MEHKSCLPCLQESATDPYREPDKSTQHALNLFHQVRINMTLECMLKCPDWYLAFRHSKQNL
jgi:hypothetical protein